MYIQIEEYLQNGILHRNKNELATATCKNMGEPY